MVFNITHVKIALVLNRINFLFFLFGFGTHIFSVFLLQTSLPSVLRHSFDKVPVVDTFSNL